MRQTQMRVRRMYGLPKETFGSTEMHCESGLATVASPGKAESVSDAHDTHPDPDPKPGSTAGWRRGDNQTRRRPWVRKSASSCWKGQWKPLACRASARSVSSL